MNYDIGASYLSINDPDYTYTSVSCSGPLLAYIAGDGGRILGMGKPGLPVLAVEEDGTPVASGVIRDDGTFIFDPEWPLQSGERVIITSPGEADEKSGECRITAPDYAPPQDLGPVEITPDGAIVRGEGMEPHALMRVFSEGVIVGSDTVGEDGRFEVRLKEPRANGGVLEVYAFDVVGNASEVISLQAPDITPPQLEMRIARNGTSVSGMVEDGASTSVWYEGPDGARIDVPVQFESAGRFFGWLPRQLGNGELVFAAAEDAAGNRHEIAAFAPDVEFPRFVEGPRHNAAANRIEGKGEARAVVCVLDADGGCVGDITSDDGSFAFELPWQPRAGERLKVTISDRHYNFLTKTVPVPNADLNASGADAGVTAVGHSPEESPVGGSAQPVEAGRAETADRAADPDPRASASASGAATPMEAEMQQDSAGLGHAQEVGVSAVPLAFDDLQQRLDVADAGAWEGGRVAEGMAEEVMTGGATGTAGAGRDDALEIVRELGSVAGDTNASLVPVGAATLPATAADGSVHVRTVRSCGETCRDPFAKYLESYLARKLVDMEPLPTALSEPEAATSRPLLPQNTETLEPAAEAACFI